MDLIDVIIIGSGPAGMSTALHLVKLDSHWSERILVLEKATHPREKLCGGGLSGFAEQCLSTLGLTLDVPHFAVNELQLRFDKQVFSIKANPILRIVHRAEFDHWLVKIGLWEGIRVQQGEEVIDVVPHAGYIEVITEKDAYHAKTVVAADGALSLVKRKLHWQSLGPTARLLEVLTPVDPQETLEFQEGVAVFDFTPMADGLQGYCWDIPSFVHQQPAMNRGIYDSRMRPERPHAGLKNIFTKHLAQYHLTMGDVLLKSHPIALYNAKTPLSQHQLLLVGDAAGTDPLFGEGIPYALAYGEVAAVEIDDAFAKGDFTFQGYQARIMRHPLLNQLTYRALAARVLYKMPEHSRMTHHLSTLVPVTFNILARVKPRYIPVKNGRMVRHGKRKKITG
jgi:flavin-dependent dehydrogenase